MQACTGGRRALVVATALTAATATGGCSYVFMPSPAAVAKQPDGCTTDQVVPNVDAVVSMVGIAGDALTLLFLLTAFRYGGEAGPLAMVGLGSGLVFTGLAVEFNSAAKYGFASAQACRRAHAPAVRRPAPPVR